MPRLAPRLPGVRFAAVAPARPEPLPRMDVAVFVGFASAGPLHVPVAVQDAAQFAAVFGPDLYLGRPGPSDAADRSDAGHRPDAPDRGRADDAGRAYAHLGPCVRDFFRNGGR